MKRIAMLALLALAPFALAQSTITDLIIDGAGTARFTWDYPADADPAPDGFRLYWDSSPLPTTLSELRASDALSLDIIGGDVRTSTQSFTMQEDQTLWFRLTAARDLDGDGTFDVESPPSQQDASKTFRLQVTDNRAPPAPTGLQLDMTITCTTNIDGVTCEFIVTD